MTKKQSKPSEFEAMGKLYEILKDFEVGARLRMWTAVTDKIAAEAPKPRKQRSDAGKAKAGNAAAVAELRRTAEH